MDTTSESGTQTATGITQDFTVTPNDFATQSTARPVARSRLGTSVVMRNSSTVHRGILRPRSPTPEATTRKTEINGPWGTQKVLLVERDTMQTNDRISSRDQKIQSLTDLVCKRIFFVNLR